MCVVCAWCVRGVCVVCAWCVRGVCVVCATVRVLVPACLHKCVCSTKPTSHTHTRTHAHTHTRTHAHTHTCTHAHLPLFADTYTHAHAHTHTNANTATVWQMLRYDLLSKLRPKTRAGRVRASSFSRGVCVCVCSGGVVVYWRGGCVAAGAVCALKHVLVVYLSTHRAKMWGPVCVCVCVCVV